jgi:hypothetical protein
MAVARRAGRSRALPMLNLCEMIRFGLDCRDQSMVGRGRHRRGPDRLDGRRRLAQRSGAVRPRLPGVHPVGHRDGRAGRPPGHPARPAPGREVRRPQGPDRGAVRAGRRRPPAARVPARWPRLTPPTPTRNPRRPGAPPSRTNRLCGSPWAGTVAGTYRQHAPRFIDLGWIRRADRGRAVHLTDDGQAGLRETFGVSPG